MKIPPTRIYPLPTWIESKQPNMAFAWNNFLSRAVLGYISYEEWKIAKALSSEWPTCACGNQCALIPRLPSGCPRDTTLVSLGCSFSKQIFEQNFAAAKITLSLIETRSAQLLCQP